MLHNIPPSDIRARNPIAATIAGVTNGTANRALTMRTCFHSLRAKCQAIGRPITTVARAETDASTKVKYRDSRFEGLSKNVEIALKTETPVTVWSLIIAKRSGANDNTAKIITAEIAIIFCR